MRKWIGAAACAAAVVCAHAARADYEGRAVGNWRVTEQADRFGDGGTHVAVTQSSGVSLAVRCINKRLSLAISDPAWQMKAGGEVKVRLRIDRGGVFDEFGDVRDGGLVEVVVTDNAEVREMAGAKEAAIRIDGGGVVATYVFKVAGARRAFADLARVCPLD